MNIKERKQFEAFKVLKPAKNRQKPKSIEGNFPKHLENSEIQNELNGIKELEEQNHRNDLIY